MQGVLSRWWYGGIGTEVIVSKTFEMVRAVGIEPTAYGLKVREDNGVSPAETGSSDNVNSVLASCLAIIRETSPDLATIVAAWHTLPEAVRVGILAMVRAMEQCQS